MTIKAHRLVAIGLCMLALPGTGCRSDLETWAKKHEVRPYVSAREAKHDALAVVLSAATPPNFTVKFSGLIVHAKFSSSAADSDPRRSVLVKGADGMDHVPILIVDKPTDSGELATLMKQLYDATGKTSDCAKIQNRCMVEIEGVHARIRGDGGASGSTAMPPLVPTKSFDCLVPHLKTVASGTNTETEILGIVLQNEPALPADPSSAWFEIDGGGELTACPFGLGGFYGTNTTACSQFANLVYWSGAVNETPKLQMRSDKTPKDGNGNPTWVNIDVPYAGLLDIVITNDPRTSMSPSTAHFELFERVLNGAQLPSLTANCIVPAASRCARCSGSSVLIPGCSDSQWP